MKDFKKLHIWQKGKDIVVDAYSITQTLPKSEIYGLVSQINRAAVSVPANIAEGSSRKSNKDYARFLQIALGSLFELETLISITHDLNMLSIEKTNLINIKIIEEQKMISSLITKLNNN